ncbi:MAG: hypothetical protein B6U97_01020 [Candidatus Altiarchaeales archaeon ex4484_96]|nr:MAG: hypothetical protein B6U97_01020 [Candidatus Altiarchaeales archaeon ex4484_96]
MKRDELYKITNKLQELKLTEYQSKALAALNALGEAKAPQIIELTDIPQARIYQILEELLEMGALRKKPGRPMKYVAINPDKALGNIISWRTMKHERELENLNKVKKDITSIMQKIYSKENKQNTDRSFLEIISAGEISEIETKKACDKAEKEILILTGVFEYLPRMLSTLRKADDRKIKLRILFLKPDRLTQESRETQREAIATLQDSLVNLEIRYTSDMPLRATIIDDDKAALFSVDKGKRIPIKDMALTEDKNMVKTLNQYFKYRWGEGKV